MGCLAIAIQFEVEPLFGIISHTKNTWVWDQRVEVGVAPLTIIPNNTRSEFLLPVSSNLAIADLEG